MERYSTLWGTDKAGVYGRQGVSKRLSSFLVQKIGGGNVKDVVGLTEKLIAGIKTLPGYELETLANKPLAVVYAPLYLKNKPGMPKDMKAFCAMSVSGLEHRVGRKESAYSHTIFFSREDMLTAGEYNYLDQLMGTHLITSQEVRSHRNGTYRVNFEQLPQKVEPILMKQDLPFVFKTIEALYQKKNVVLVLEEGVNFNRRATELLTQLYSMMQPMLATETGFATYQTQERILELSGETNVQIYLVPAGSDLSALPGSKFEILNLSNGASVLERTPVSLTLAEWIKYDWKRRLRAMEHLFAKNNDYLNAELFVSLSKDFFAQDKALNEWYADTSKHKTFSSVEELQREDQTQSGWRLVPWAGELFERKYPHLLKEQTVDVLNARNVAAFYEYNGKDEELKKRSAGAVDAAAVNKAAKQYQYGRKLAGVNEAELSKLIWEKADSRLKPAYIGEINGLNAKLQSQESEFKTAWGNREKAYNDEVAGLKSSHEAALGAAVAAEAAKTAMAQQQLKTEKEAHVQKVAQLQSTHEAALKEAVAAEQEKTAQVQSKLDAADAVREQQLAELRNAANQKLTDLKTAANQEIGKLNGQLNEANDKLDKATVTIQGLDENLAQANRTITGLNADLTRAGEANDTLNKELTKAQNHAKSLEADVKSKDATITDQGKKIKHLEDQYRRATGGDVPPPDKMPKVAIWVVAVAALGCLLLGILLGSLIGKGKDGPVETTAPIETTTVPIETTAPIVSEPEETTLPIVTVPETAWLEDGQVNWDYVYDQVTWIGAVETNPAVMEERLGEAQIAADGWETEAVLLPSNWAIGEDGVVPAFITVLRASEEPANEESRSEEPAETKADEAQESADGEGTPAEAEAAASAQDLLDAGRLVIDNGERCFVVRFSYGDEYNFKRNAAIGAALKIVGLLSEEHAELNSFCYMLEDGRTVDLQMMMLDAGLDADWWTGLEELSLKEQDLADMSHNLGTQRETVTKIVMADGTEGCILDYAKNATKAKEMVDLSLDKGRSASRVDDFVFLLLNERVTAENNE